MKQPLKTHTISAKCGYDKVTVFIVEVPEKGGFWWAIKNAHYVFFTDGKPFRSGTQVNNVSNDDLFTYYGNGSEERPDRVTDMDTLLWLLRDK